MKLTFYNTLTRKKEEFHSIDENRVRMYVVDLRSTAMHILEILELTYLWIH